ncbi:hypothetical protein JQ597_04555 [Bradyrhizobium sp. AUGA SZCCT0177]|uniref:hypothetical protein n=1 Tax=Bradyrhizobium sp. AUGA SZCCT0177 TaxID=2807665 RepID=UPI001BA4755E|nr:hypothetical protein [Bradyrhizobium sp. AUGA SZCCT0177]MBR1281306.1 hypothetical protein [Bradyrhizobium sp. AUGA SZCCT0177]
MSEIPIKVQIPYIQTYIPWRHKKPRRQHLWSDGFIMIKEVVAEAAPVSHRIFGQDGRLEAEVRRFGDGYWWALNKRQPAATMAEVGNEWRKTGHPIAIKEFISAAEKRNGNVFWAALGCFGPVIDPISEDEFFEKKPRLLQSTLKRQWSRATHGASRTIYCDGLVMVKAGLPTYYGVRRSGGVDIVAGPSEFDRVYGEYRLFGPDRDTRRESAASGLAFGRQEFCREEPLLRLREDFVRVVCRIDEFVSPPPVESGPLMCARVLAADLWDRAKDKYNLGWAVLRVHVASLAGAAESSPSVENLPFRRILEDFVAVDWTGITNEFSGRVQDAQEILRRLDFVGVSQLADEDEAALANLELYPPIQKLTG